MLSAVSFSAVAIRRGRSMEMPDLLAENSWCASGCGFVVAIHRQSVIRPALKRWAHEDVEVPVRREPKGQKFHGKINSPRWHW